jgi:carboxymethylenebutenolidase
MTDGTDGTRKKASDFPPGLLDLFQVYVHGGMSRRAFLDGAQQFATAGVTAAALFEMLRPNYALAIQVPKDDRRIHQESVIVPSPDGTGNIRCVLARPANSAGRKLPAIVVVHENRGLNPYIEDVARRLAVQGYLALAPDGLTSVGGYQQDDEKGAALFRQVDAAKMREDFLASGRWLRSRSEATGKLGVVGFCYGGGVSNFLAVRMGADLAAAVPFYGAAPDPADVPKIKAALLVQLAEKDDRINGLWPAYDQAMKAAGVVHEGHTYPGTNHGFHNDTTPRYDEAAAKLAWQRTLDWFGKYVKA